MSQEVLNRFMEIIPHRELSVCDVDELFTACNIAFEMIGYSPVNMEQSFHQALEKSSSNILPCFAYDVYLEDIS